MATVVLVGALDTKGDEYRYVRGHLHARNCDVLTVDVGVLGPPGFPPDVSRHEVARAAGADLSGLAAASDRGVAMEAMARGAAEVVRRLHREGRLDGILALGGSGGTSVATQAMRALPIGVPKLMVSTVAAGDTRPYVGGSDVTMMYSVVDIAGINRISERILTNAASAMAGMATAARSFTPSPTTGTRPIVGATMFGVTTPCVNRARDRLEDWGYEVVVFHATGTGGQSMEALIQDGFITAVLDVTTTELADQLVGGMLPAGPNRLEVAGWYGIPQVVSLGALDMVNFGPIETVPQHFRHRKLHKHNPNVTLMRTTPEECAQLGRIVARKLNATKGPVTLFIPLRGVSMISRPGEVFHDPEADKALTGSLRAALDPRIEVIELDTDINDPMFAETMAAKLHHHYQIWSERRT